MKVPAGTLAGIGITACVLLAGNVPVRAQGPASSAPPSPAVVIDGPPPPVPPAVVSRDEAGQVTLRATRLAESIDVDGRLDERVYQTVPSVTDFIQQEPDEGAPATEQTEIWVLFDDDSIYISARCWDSHPERIVANEMRRDSFNLFGNDFFAVVLDTFYDRRNAFTFLVTPLGGLFDGQVDNERDVSVDWNTVWDAKAGRFENGWTVEMVVPFKSLRYRAGTPQIWGINLERVVRWKNESSHLTPIPASLNVMGVFKISSSATLVGIEVPSSRPPLEVKPYGISDVTTDLQEDPPVSNEPDAAFGLDVKYGLTKGLTADFTYNTDFAQVEVDEQQVNLTRFSLFFPEKREFFLEGEGIFEFGGGDRFTPTSYYPSGGQFERTTPILFFSRRIGLHEDGTVPIDVGGRVTGRVGKYTVGALNIQTDEEPVSGAVPTNFTVVRVKRNILRRSSIGAIFTGRSVSTEGDGSNEVYGVDGLFSFHDNVNINTYLARTRTPGLSGDELSYRAQLDYTGDRYGVQVQRLVVGENFNPEIGFLRRDDMRQNFALFRFSPRPQSIAAIRKLWWEGSFDYISNSSAGQLETRIAKGEFGIELENSDLFSVTYKRNYEFLTEEFDITDEVTIPVGGYSFQDLRVSYYFGQQRAVSGTLIAEHGGFFGGEKTGISYLLARVAVVPRFSVEPNVSFNWVDVPQGNFITSLVGARTTYTLTPRMFVSALLQYNSSDDSFGTNVRLRWEYQPGSELFVVYTDERLTEGPGFPGIENRAFVVKVNRLFRF